MLIGRGGFQPARFCSTCELLHLAGNELSLACKLYPIGQAASSCSSVNR